MADILVLHSSDSIDCSKYILDYLSKDDYHLCTSSLLDSNLCLDQTAPKVKVLILILSAGHLEFLRNCTSCSTYEERIRNAGTTLIYLYGLGEDDEGESDCGEPGSRLRSRIPAYREIPKFPYEQHEELLKTTMIKVEGLDACEGVDQGAKAAEKKAGVAGRKGAKRAQGRKFKVIPKTARCETSTSMVLCLCETSDDTEQREGEDKEDKEVVTVAFGSNDPEKQIVLPTERINRNTYLFCAPEHCEGVVPFHVVINGDVIGHSSIAYQSLQTDLVLAVSQLYMFLLNRLLGLIQEKGQLTADVDRRLCGLLEDDEANSIPIQAFEQLFSLSAASKGRIDCELPSLLHLSAKYGLLEFASKLRDLPDAALASELPNHKGQTPDDLTRSRGQAKVVEDQQVLGYQNMKPNVRVEEAEEGVYESFYPMEEGSNSTAANRKDLTVPCGKALEEEEDPYMVFPSDEMNEGGDRLVDHPMFPELPKDKRDDTGHPPSLVSAKQHELTPKPTKTKTSIVERLFKKTKSPKQSKTTHSLSPSSPSIPEDIYPPPPPTPSSDFYSSSSPRNSSASNSSRDSCMSKGSTSGIETVDEEDDEDVTNYSTDYHSTVTTFVPRKSSANLEQLEEDLRRPNAPRPPPPPLRKTPVKPSMVDPDKVEYLSMEGAYNRPSPGSQPWRQGPPVGPRTRKMSCPAVTPLNSAPFNRQFSAGQAGKNDSPADGDAKHSSGDAFRPSSLAEESGRPRPLPGRKMSLPLNNYLENSARGRPLPPVKK